MLMSRSVVRSAGFVLGLAVVVGTLAPSGTGQQPNQKKADPKDAKKVEAKPDPKKADPKPPAKQPDAKKPAPKPPAQKPKPQDPSPAAPEPAADGPPNPLDLVRGLRDHGLSDLALEYLQELEKKPGVSPAIKAEVPLERAKCALEAVDEESDEGTRANLIGEAKEGFTAFLNNPANKNHPRAAEAFLALARVTALQAKAQLSRARQVDVPADDDAAAAKQKAEAAKARPLFQAAATQLKEAVKRIEGQAEKTTDPAARRRLAQSLYDAELARGTNQFDLAETYGLENATTKEIQARDAALEEARDIFAGLAEREGAPARVTGVARAWMAECLFEQKKLSEGEAEFKRIEASSSLEAEDAKRTVRYFSLRRKARQADSAAAVQAVAAQCRDWLRLYGNVRRAQAEAFGVRWILANALQVEGNAAMPKNPPKTGAVTIPATARIRYQEAEKLYRAIAQSDNEYTERANRQRMVVVRRLLGDAALPPAAYKTFEECQMASLIQMGQLIDLEKDPAKRGGDEVRAKKHAVVAMLERARELATPQDNPNDVTDVLVRLVFFYTQTDQPQEAAVLAEHIARTARGAGGKAADAGARGLYAYALSTGAIRTTDAAGRGAAMKADRDRAMRLARYLDEKFPNDPATDRARLALARLLYEDGKPEAAYDAVLKVRPGYEGVAGARLFEGAVASQMLTAKDLPLTPDRKLAIFHRTTGDLAKLVKPLPAAAEGEVTPYLSARCRLAYLYLLQPRVAPEDEKKAPGYAKARQVAEEALAQIPTFPALLLDREAKAPNADGWELKLLAEDARTRAVFLQGQDLFVKGKYVEAYTAIGDVLAEMNGAGPYADQLKAAFGGGPKPAPAPKKEPEKKDAVPKAAEPKKEPEKKAPEPKKEAAGGTVGDGPSAELKSRADEVDRLRRELIVLALKIRLKQGQAEKGAQQLDLLKRYGGSLEASVGTLEQVAGEMAAQVVALRREGKADDAKALSDGFAKLLDKVSAEPNLPPAVQRFLGQALILVGQYDKAVAALQKVPAPADKAALAKPNDIKNNADLKKQVLEYRRAALELSRAYRLGGKFAEADALLADAMGTQEKQGWAFSSVDFRQEVALLCEAKGAAEPDVKKANAEWSKALREWSTLYNVYRNAVQKLPPQAEAGGGGNQRLAVLNAYFEAFFNVQRCLVKANKQLLADPKFAAKLQKAYDDVGKRFADVEKSSGADINEEVRGMYHDLLMEVPELKKAYEAAGGKMFLDRPSAPTAGGM
jgi:hypothetical protein